MDPLRHSAFERKVLKAVAVIGTLRAIIELSLDLPATDRYIDLYLDLTALVVFLLGMILVFRGAADQWIRWFFYLPLILLISYSMYFYKGLASSQEITVYGVAVVINLTMRGKSLLIFNGLLLLGVSTSLVFVELYYPLTKNSAIGTSIFSFVFISIAIILLVNFAKSSFDNKRKELASLNDELIERQNVLQSGNKKIDLQNRLLLALKDELHEKVLERTKQLKDQNESIEEYMKLTLIELVKPYEKILSAINQMDINDKDPIHTMIKVSGNKLSEEIEKLRTRLQLNADE